MLGLGLSIPQVAARGSRSLVAAIRSLFAANEPGVWYDPSDLSTLFQNSAGTTPVTAVEQPVGLMLDKSKGLVLGPELVTNGDFSNGTTGWSANVGSIAVTGGELAVTGFISRAVNQIPLITVNGRWYQVTGTMRRGTGSGASSVAIRATTSSDGSNTGLLAQQDSNALNVNVPINFYFLATSTATYIGLVGNGEGYFDNISVRELPGNHASQTTATSRPVLSARVNQYLATETLATQNVTTLAAQYRLSFEGTGTITLSGAATGVYLAGSHLITCTAGTLTSTVSGSVTKADLRVANDGANLPPYQRVNTATDYDAAGFPHYLRFDGVDDWMVTNTITPGIDKVQVFAGVRKLSDAASGLLLETGTNAVTVDGTLNILAPDASNSFRTISRGTAFTVAGTGTFAPAPISAILGVNASIGGDSLGLRVNGSQVAQSAADQGTGNYLAYPLYIGRRGGTSLPFNGHLYSLIVRFGNNLPTATIEKTEKYINTKTRAY